VTGGHREGATVADKLEIIGKADYKDKAQDIDVDKAWDDAKKWMAKVGVSTSSKPDAKKIRDAMAKQKKALVFVAVFDGKWLTIQARVGTAAIEDETAQDLSGGGDQKEWRGALEQLHKNSKLVADADLKAFDDKHPDPDEVGKLKSRLDTLTRELRLLDMQIKRLQNEAKPKSEELLRVQKAIKALGG
jgi:hypothetical protein